MMAAASTNHAIDYKLSRGEICVANFKPPENGPSLSSHFCVRNLTSVGGSKFNLKKKSTPTRIWCQRICLSVCLSITTSKKVCTFECQSCIDWPDFFI